MAEICRYRQFLLDKEQGKDDAKLRYRIRWNGYVVAFNVGYRVTIDKWSPETQRCKNSTTHGKKKVSASDINKAIQQMEDAVDEVFSRFEASNTVPTADEFRHAFRVHVGREKSQQEVMTISTVCEKFIQIKGHENSWTPQTKTKINTVKRHLIECFGDISVDSISNEMMSSLIDFLIKNNHRNTTISKDLNIIKWILRWAKNNGLYSGDVHLSFKPKLKGISGRLREVIYLTWDELTQLFAMEIQRQSLASVRDVFCFCCFTGLRYSDAATLKKIDVHDTHISVVTEKTDEVIKIELNKYSQAILNRYKDIPLPNDLALPIISNQKMNERLKDLAKLAGLKEPIRIAYFKGNQRFEEVKPKHDLITTHCGRRTFIVNALYLGIPAEVIMKWTGHSDFDAMKPYVEIVDLLKAREMDKFNQH